MNTTKKVLLAAVSAASLLGLDGSYQVALAQSGCPILTYGAVPTVTQWQSCFQAKQDFGGAGGGTGAITGGQVIAALGYTPVNKAGDTMIGQLVTLASGSAGSGFNLPQGAAPTAPNNGDLWMTSAGLFYRFNGSTSGPLVPSVINFAAVSHQWINAITSGVPSATQPSCQDLTNGSASCFTDTTNASNISGGTLNNGRLSAQVPLINQVNTWNGGQGNPHTSLTMGATVTPNLTIANNFTLTLTGTVSTFANPSGMADGICGTIRLVQDANGNRTISAYGSFYKWPGGTPPTLSTGANLVDIVPYCTSGTTEVDASFIQGFH